MIKEAINRVVNGQSLTVEEAGTVMEEIMSGQVTPAQFGALVTALRCKGETVDEITGMVKTMRAKAVPVHIEGTVVDTCGTGGDSLGTFNISTTTAFVAAGAGIKIAKHGNRAMSSRCGSADVLEILGVKVELTAAQVKQCIEKIGIGFMFAPAFHPSMKFASQPRREIGIRTVFNILGPLSNPAGVGAQVLGVADAGMAAKMAQALCNLNCRHGIVVHGEDGLDEITTTATTTVYEVKNGRVTKSVIHPGDFNIPSAGLDDLKGGTVQENGAILKSVLSGEKGARRDIVLLNAAAAIVAGGAAEDLKQGIALAEAAIDSGRALEKMERLIEFTRNCG
ncbi:MAG: anthranilate phosphoribosyltransferase [Dehalococcoidales bacterium]|nr:anthranilate phosphoribosyltransferase [Dehalococcoidales bacterium]